MEAKELSQSCAIDKSDKASRIGRGNRQPRLLNNGTEEIWNEEVHAAFMEALKFFPPSRGLRLKYFQSPTEESEKSKSVGRYQLIQSYIYEKTGKTRSRKQISSHLQRMRITHKEDPEVMALLSPGSVPAIPRSPDVFVAGRPSSPICRSNIFKHSDESKLCDELLFSGQCNQSLLQPLLISSFSTNANNELCNPALNPVVNVSSMSQRRLASNIPSLQSQVQMPPLQQISLPVHTHHALPSPYSTPAILNYHQVPITPIDQIMHTPANPPQVPLHARRKFIQRTDDDWKRTLELTSPVDSTRPCGPYFNSPVSHATGFSVPRVASSYSVTRALTNHIHFNASPSQPDQLLFRPFHLSRRLSYSHAYTMASSALITPGMSPMLGDMSDLTISSAARTNPASDPVSQEPLASPLVIENNDLRHTSTFTPDNTFLL